MHVQNTHAKREEVRGRKRRTQRWREGGREGDKDKEGNRNREREREGREERREILIDHQSWKTPSYNTPG